MNADEFTSKAPGQLVRTREGPLAFVPNPLPDSVGLSSVAVRRLASAENALGRLQGTAAREFNPYLIGSPLLHREAILSSRIEGTVTTPEQLVLLQTAAEVDAARAEDADTREVLNYVRAMRHGLDLLERIPPSLRLIREIHSVLMAGVRGDRETPGEFRTVQNFIADSRLDTIHEARFVPPPPAQMREALEKLEVYLNMQLLAGSDPFLVRLGLAHYQFEAIHPFRDGNGRVGRLLIPLLLCSHGRLNEPLLYLSAYFERNRGRYMDLLLRVSQRAAFMPWIEFFLEGVEQSATEATEQALALLDLRQTYHREFQKGRSSALLIRLVDRLFEVPSITKNQAAELLEVSHQAASSNVRKLVNAGILEEITGGRRNQVFVAPRILDFIQVDGPSQPR